MSTQQDIYAVGSESRPPMLNKENYVPWSYRLLGYAKSRPNGKLIHNSILNGSYVRKMIPEPGSNIVIQEKKAKLFNEWERFTSNERESIESYYHRFLKLMNDLKRNKHFPEKIASNLKFLNNLQPSGVDMLPLFIRLRICIQLITLNSPHQDHPSFNQNYLQQPIPNHEDITDPTTAMNMALALMAKAFKLNYSTPTNNNQRISSNPRNRQISQPGMNMGQDRQMQMVGGNGENQFMQYAGQNAGNPAGYNDVIGNQIGNGNLVAARAEGNVAGQNGNQIRCYNCMGVAKFVGDFKSLAKEADDSLTKHKALELEIERLLKAVISQDIMIIVQNESVVDTSDLQTELEHTKKCFENCIIKKETEYAKLWNDWYKKCDECKYNKISYGKAYKDMQQKIERLQAQLGDLKGKTKDTSCVSNTRNLLSQKLKNKNVELEFQ
nr:hypothetical protein [Tanacetum cinerariifolium]